MSQKAVSLFSFRCVALFKVLFIIQLACCGTLLQQKSATQQQVNEVL